MIGKMKERGREREPREGERLKDKMRRKKMVKIGSTGEEM